MKKSILYILVLFFFASITLLISRSFRVQKVPHGGKFSCNTCHTNGGGTPRNPFGLDVESRVTPNGQENFWGPELAALDSDGDGFTNGEELQDPNGTWQPSQSAPGDASLVTHPGIASDFPTSVNLVEGSPNQYQLFNNYPNPFNPTTTIKFSVPNASQVNINIFNSLGQLVNELVNDNFSSGQYSAVWNGRDNFGSVLPSGIYFYRMTTGDFVQSKRMILLK